MNSSIRKKFAHYETPRRVGMAFGDKIDNYEIKSLLGEGAFGIVYEVEDRSGRLYALKLIKLWEIAHEKERKDIISRFLREFEIGTVRSNYIVTSLDCGKIGGNPYIVMELCKGGVLSDWIGNTPDLRVINKVAHQVLLGLQEIHNRGYFHRDIKPQNILLDEYGNAKLADFGIAGHKNSRTTVKNIFGHAERIFGTWAYIAPEQANNKTAFRALDAVADIYSFGIMMYEVMTGAYPFPPYRITDESELADYLLHARKGNYKGLEEHWNRLPGNWNQIIRSCIEADYQHKRYQTVGQIINALGYKSIEIDHPEYEAEKNDLVLIVTYGDETGKVYHLSKMLINRNEGLLTLGRKDASVKNDIEIIEVSSSYISRRHATIEKWTNPDRWIIRDGQYMNGAWQESVNNLYINSKRVSPVGIDIKPGDIITMGDTILKVSVTHR